VRVDRLVRFDTIPILEILRLSVGTIGQFLIATVSWVILMWMVGRFDAAVVAGYTTGLRILMFALLPAWGLSNAAATLVGQNLGAKQPERAERSVWLTGAYDMVFLAAVTLVLELLPGPIVALFASDPAVQEKIFGLLGIDDTQAQTRFGFLLEGLRAGAPPHGGIAFGFERISMLLSGATSLRDVIAFPKTTAARALFEGAPTVVPPHDLKDLHIQLESQRA
jgi:hypothetical protein